MADDLKPLPVKDAAPADDLGSDFASADFDGALKAQTAAARSKPISDFPGDKPPADEPVVASGNVDDDALVAAVTTEPTTADAPKPDATPPVESGKPVAAGGADPAALPAAEKPASAPAKPEPRVYDPAEKFALSDGVEITREQLTRGLQERHAWGQAANAFQQVFRCTPEQAQQYWKPYMDKLVADPKLGEHVDAALQEYENPAKRAYIDKCRAFFDEQTPAAQPAARQQPAALPPEVARELEASRQFRQQMETQNAMAQVAAEKRELVSLHPQLADETLMQLVAQRTYAVLAEQQRTGVAQTYTLSQAARDLKAVIDKWGPQPAAPAAGPPVKVPALNTSSGAAVSTRPPIDMKPKKFASPDAAIEDWERNMAGPLGFK